MLYLCQVPLTWLRFASNDENPSRPIMVGRRNSISWKYGHLGYSEKIFFLVSWQNHHKIVTILWFTACSFPTCPRARHLFEEYPVVVPQGRPQFENFLRIWHLMCVDKVTILFLKTNWMKRLSPISITILSQCENYVLSFSRTPTASHLSSSSCFCRNSYWLSRAPSFPWWAKWDGPSWHGAGVPESIFLFSPHTNASQNYNFGRK